MEKMTSFEGFTEGFGHEENVQFYEAVTHVQEHDNEGAIFRIEPGMGDQTLVSYGNRQLVLTPKALEYLPVFLDKKAQAASCDPTMDFPSFESFLAAIEEED